MPTTPVHLTTGSSDTDGTVYTTASISPGANRAVFVAVSSTQATAAPTVTVTGCGLTWESIAQTPTLATATKYLTLFRSMGAAPTTGALTITSATTLTGCAWSVVEVPSVNTSGTNGSGAVVQPIANRVNTGAATAVDLPFDAPVDPANPVLGFVSLNSTTIPTPGAGWTSLGSTAGTTPANSLRAMRDDSAQQNITANWTGATSTWTVGVEVLYSDGGSSLGTYTSGWTGVPTGTTVPITVRTSGATSVRLKIGTNSAVTTGVTHTSSVAPDSAGYCDFTVTGLTAGTDYWYATEIDGVLASEIGAFKTDTPGVPRNFRGAFGSCLSSSNVTTTAFNNITANAPELFLHLGDFHYGNSLSTTAATHRALYESQIAANSGLKTLLRSIPTAYITSDHDSGNNDWTGGPGPQTPAWNLAYRQVVPATPVVSDGTYHAVHRGRVKFIMTDGRSYKSPRANTDNASKTLFGFTQETWIAGQLADAAYPVKVLCVDVPWVFATTAGDDKWGGYKAAAQRLVDAIAAADANVFLIHGDAHSLCADDGSGVNNTGSLPVAGSAPLGNSTSIKGGPYSQGTWPTSGQTTQYQHGLLDITDTGDEITIRFSGRDTSNVERVTLSKTFSADAGPGPGTGVVVDRWTGSALVRQRDDRWTGSALVQQVYTP